MKFVRYLILLCALVVSLEFTRCHHRPARPAGPSVGGSVIYITNVLLPPEATIEIAFVELTRDGSVVRVIAGETLPRPKKIPQPFEIFFNQSEISQRRAYGIAAKIVAGDKVLFSTPRPTPVLTQGNPASVEVVVEPVK